MTIRSVYFIGIGGIGMSALARYFNSRGVLVSGYDARRTPLCQELEAEGMNIHYEENVALLPQKIDLVVYTPAIPVTHQELIYCREQAMTVVKRSDVLQWITETSFNICVGGSHGKTTVSTMVAYILQETGFGSNAFLGGISSNYNKNFWSSEKNNSVIEADEYDRSFLKLRPDIAIITAMDPDHLDIYETAENVENAYIEFAGNIKQGGCLIYKYGLKRTSELRADNMLSYHLQDSRADVYAQNIVVKNGTYHFDVMYKGKKLSGFVLRMGGLHNIENAIAAIAVAQYLAIDIVFTRTALASFQGVKRRFQFLLHRIHDDAPVLIDDYAHHPEEIKALISGVRSLFDEKLLVVFQPHLYSRTHDMATEFAASLDMADEVVLLPIYPARELPMAGVTSKLIADKMQLSNKQILSKEALLAYIAMKKPSLVVMCGAGDIDDLLIPVKNILTQA